MPKSTSAEHEKGFNFDDARLMCGAWRNEPNPDACKVLSSLEDDRDPSIWFLDHNYHEAMFSMFKRINAKEHIVGWYSTGPKLRENDLDVHALFHDYVPNPVLVIIDVQPKELGIPTKAYYSVEEVKEECENALVPRQKKYEVAEKMKGMSPVMFEDFVKPYQVNLDEEGALHHNDKVRYQAPVVYPAPLYRC